MNKAKILRLLEEAEARVGTAQDFLRESGKTDLAEKAYSIEGKILHLIDNVQEIV